MSLLPIAVSSHASPVGRVDGLVKVPEEARLWRMCVCLRRVLLVDVLAQCWHFGAVVDQGRYAVRVLLYLSFLVHSLAIDGRYLGLY